METCPNCGTTFDVTEADPLARVPCPNCGEKVRVSRNFNNFELVETLGIGGMGTVYKARDTLLDRFVALKLLRKDLGDEVDYETRLQQEARVAASVNHPNVIGVFSSGKDHGQFYLVMELVDHGSLDDLIEQKKTLPEELVLETGIQVAKGLRAAYAKGLIHRDVKPANILFADEHMAKIGDFGLAGVAAESGESRGEIWGTPYYVAPERLNAQPEDFRSDMYSLGATLFHAIAGRAPIEGDTNSATQLRDLKNKPLDLKKANPKVSDTTAAVLSRMIAPDQAKRYASYDEAVAALEHAYNKLTGKEDKTRKISMWIVAIAVLIIAGIAIGASMYVKKARAAAAAVAAKASAPVKLSPSAITELERKLSEARKQLQANHFNVAGAQFAAAAADARGNQPLYDFARMQQGLAAWIGREYSQARQAYQDVDNAGQGGFAKEDAEMGRFFVTTAKRLSGKEVIPGSEAAQRNATNYEPFGSLLFGLKNIEQKNAAEAIPWLEQFVNSNPGGKYAWFSELKPIAQKYLDDARTYNAWKTSPGNDPSERLAKLRDAKKAFKGRTPMSEEVFDAEKDLSGKVVELKKAEDTKRDQEQKAQVAAEQPAWAAALANYKARVQIYDFAGALDAVKNVKLTAPGLKEAQDVVVKKAQWLADWRAKLTDDLNRTHLAQEVVDMNGAKYSGFDGANAQNLAAKIGPYGSAQIPWTKFAPATLLNVSKAFIRPGVADAADRAWLCAAFAAETNQADAAKALADEAARAKPEYGAQKAVLFSTNPATR